MEFRFEVTDADGLPEHQAQAMAGLMLAVDGFKTSGLSIPEVQRRVFESILLLWDGEPTGTGN